MPIEMVSPANHFCCSGRLKRRFFHSAARLLLRHILPNAISPILVEATFGIARAIVAESGLSFLGLGVAPPAASWGSMIGEGRHFLFIAPHLVTAPGAAILLTVMAFNFVGDGLRDALDVHRTATP